MNRNRWSRGDSLTLGSRTDALVDSIYCLNWRRHKAFSTMKRKSSCSCILLCTGSPFILFQPKSTCNADKKQLYFDLQIQSLRCMRVSQKISCWHVIWSNASIMGLMYFEAPSVSFLVMLYLSFLKFCAVKPSTCKLILRLFAFGSSFVVPFSFTANIWNAWPTSSNTFFVPSWLVSQCCEIGNGNIFSMMPAFGLICFTIFVWKFAALLMSLLHPSITNTKEAVSASKTLVA